MSSGKYRITKIKRKWNGEYGESFALERIIKDKKVKLIIKDKGREIDNEKITQVYFDLVTNTKTHVNFSGSENSYVFKTSQMKKSIEEDCVIIKSYDETAFQELQKKYEVKKKKITYEKESKEKIIREFYENEKEIWQERVEISSKINTFFYDLCRTIFFIAKNNEIFEKEKCLKHFKIEKGGFSYEDIREFKLAFKQQTETSLSPEKLISRMFNSKRSIIVKDFFVEIYKSNISDEISKTKWLKEEGIKFLEKIYNEYVNQIKYKERENKFKHKSNGVDADRKKRLEQQLRVSKNQEYDINKYYQNSDRLEGIKNLSILEENNLCDKINSIIQKYNLKELEKSIKEDNTIILSENLEQRESEITKFIVKIKEHYTNIVVKEIENEGYNLKNEDKLLLQWIHQYVKGRYNKCKNLIIINKTEAIDCKNLFEKEELNKKIKKSILNKIRSYKEFEKRKDIHNNIKTSFDLELLKANETFVSKIGTAVSKVGFVLNIQLYTEGQLKNPLQGPPDILASPKKIGEVEEDSKLGIMKSQMSVFHELYPEFDKEDNLVRQLILFVQRLRHQIAHYQQSLRPMNQIKIGKYNGKEYYETGISEYRNFDEIKTYYEKIINKMPEYFIEKYKSNNVFNILRGNETEIVSLVNKFNFSMANNSSIFPKFYKIYMKLNENFKNSEEEIKKGAHKYILQTIYYNFFQHEILFNEKLKSEFKNNYKEKLKENKKTADDIKKIVDNNIIFKNYSCDGIDMYRNIQQQGTIENKQKLYNNEWCKFIAFAFEKFIKLKCNWISIEKFHEFDNNYSFEEKYRKAIIDNLKPKYKILEIDSDESKTLIIEEKENYKNDEEFIYSFIALSSFLDLKEISNIRHDIAKYIQFISKLVNRSKDYESYKSYIEVLKKISDSLEVMLEHKEKLILDKTLSFDSKVELSVILDEQLLSKSIEDIKIDIKTKDGVIKQEIFKQNDINGTTGKWIAIYGIEQAKRNGTFIFFKEFFSNRKYLINEKKLKGYERLYNEKETNQNIVNDFIEEYKSSKKYTVDDNYKNVIKCNNSKIEYQYYSNMIHGNILKLGYDFINDIFGHFLGWVQRIERDKSYGTEIDKEGLRKRIVHFGYFKYTKHSLLEICNQFYKLFSYNIKYQRDVQTVMNNIFEKYGIVAYNIDNGKIIDKAKVLIYDYKDGKLKFSDHDNNNNKFIQIGAKSHMYFPEIKLIHENQVDMLRSLFEYKKS